jgi:hypothetical protein
MHIIQRGKSSKNEIPLDGDKAVESTSFRTYTNKIRNETIEHQSLGWLLVSTQMPEPGQKRAKYQDNTFELHIALAEIDRLIYALQVAKERFSKQEVPGVQQEANA